MHIKSAILSAYRRVVPEKLRAKIRYLPGVAWIRKYLWESDTRLHDQYYKGSYYEVIDEKYARDAAPHVARQAIARFSPTSVIDTGCGSGLYLQAFVQQGVEAHGVELSAAALGRCRAIGLDVRKHDLTKGEPLPWTADLVYSIEVAEHLAAKYARNFVATITGAARKIAVLTAAHPGQGGANHINCRPREYWIRLFAERGFEYDAVTSEDWQRSNCQASLPDWFRDNLMVFRRTQPLA
jgi:SAM-dependent methyltransferase